MNLDLAYNAEANQVIQNHTNNNCDMAEMVLIVEAVERSSYTPRHISLLLRNGDVKGKKVGRIWLVDIDDLLRYESEMKELGDKKYNPHRGAKG